MLMKDKVALVTGAGSGIGRAIAVAYAREGAQLVLCDVDEAGLAKTRARVPGVNAIQVLADVRREPEVQRLIERTVDRYGRIDIACNNAGIGGELTPTAQYPRDAWQLVLDVNLTGVFLCMKHQIGQMLRNGGGAIVNVASILGAVGFANACAYTAAKHGVVGLTRTAALEYAQHGIRVTAVGPAFIHTPMIAKLDDAARAALQAAHPAGRLGMPEEVAELVAWLSSEKASFVTGSYHPVDGGYLAQ